jgi:hypothetical protein
MLRKARTAGPGKPQRGIQTRLNGGKGSLLLCREIHPAKKPRVGTLIVTFHGGVGQIADKPSTPRHPFEHFIKLVPIKDTFIFAKLHFEMCLGGIDIT